MTPRQRNRAREARQARSPVCTHPLGCPAPALEDWPYCVRHHAHVLDRGEELRAAKQTELESRSAT